MERYGFLIIAVSLLLPLVLSLILRKDIIRPAIKIGLYGGLLGLVSEVFYFRGYWRPPSLFGVAVPSIEDFLFGFAVAAIGIVIYPAISLKYYIRSHYPQKLDVGVKMFIIGLVGMIIFNIFLSVNSIIVSSMFFLIFAVIVGAYREDLIKAGLVTGLVLTAYIYIIYYLFALAFPDYAEKYWLVHDTSLGTMIDGKVPVTELIWYATWGMFAGIFYAFVTGTGFTVKKSG